MSAFTLPAGCARSFCVPAAYRTGSSCAKELINYHIKRTEESSMRVIRRSLHMLHLNYLAPV
jgi:hypothetical protein